MPTSSRLCSWCKQQPICAWAGREARANILNNSFNEVFGALVTSALFMGIYVAVYQNARLVDVPYLWWGWVLAFLLNDLAYYTDHRIAHRTGFFWAIHVPPQNPRIHQKVEG
jgi:sterol desaturase/sphingolipid hydroxylase (fatty acid hydroxylase superfamily)